MSQTAKVRSVEAIHDFKVALTNFSEDARNALGSVDMEIRRVRDWLQRDQYVHWQGQVKRRNELVGMARTELHRRRLSQQNSDAISDTEQKENLRTAERRLAEAEEKVRVIKKWIPVLDHAIAEYHSCSQPLGDCLSGTLQNSLALLERIVRSVEAYLDLAPPSSGPAPEETGNTGSAAVAAPRAVSAVPANAPEADAGETPPGVGPTSVDPSEPDQEEASP